MEVISHNIDMFSVIISTGKAFTFYCAIRAEEFAARNEGSIRSWK